MAKVVQLETGEKQPDSPLTPELKDFIDRVIVPILIERYLENQDAEDDLANDATGMRKSHNKPAA